MDDHQGPLPLDDAQRFLRSLWALNHAIELRSKEMAARLGITFQQRTVLRLIGRFPGVTAGKLAETLHVDRGTLSATLRRLEARGLIQRRIDPRDRRRIRLGLTARGHTFDVAASGTVESAVERTMAEASAGRIAATEAVLLALLRNLEQPTPIALSAQIRSSSSPRLAVAPAARRAPRPA